MSSKGQAMNVSSRGNVLDVSSCDKLMYRRDSELNINSCTDNDNGAIL